MENITFQTLPEVVSWNANYKKDEVAFVHENYTTSFSEFNIFTNQIANGLIHEKIQPVAKVALLAKDSNLTYELLFGCAKAKAVLVGINWRLAPQEIIYIINQSESEILFVGEEFFPVVEKIENIHTTLALYEQLGHSFSDVLQMDNSLESLWSTRKLDRRN